MTVLDRSQASECINATNLLSFGSSRAFPNSSNLGAPPPAPPASSGWYSGRFRLIHLPAADPNPWPTVLQKVRIWRGQPPESHPATRLIGNESDASVEFSVPRQGPKVARPPPTPSVPRPDRFGRRPFGSEPTIHIPELGPLSSLVIERRIRQVCEGNWSPKFCLAKVPISPG
jgi:hypothetical protein